MQHCIHSVVNPWKSWLRICSVQPIDLALRYPILLLREDKDITDNLRTRGHFSFFYCQITCVQQKKIKEKEAVKDVLKRRYCTNNLVRSVWIQPDYSIIKSITVNSMHSLFSLCPCSCLRNSAYSWLPVRVVFLFSIFLSYWVKVHCMNSRES